MELPKKLQSKLTSVPENVSVANSLDPDEQAIRDFKMKYQKSLEAIQSLQEILELKKEMGSIKHTYDPVSLRLIPSNLPSEQIFIS